MRETIIKVALGLDIAVAGLIPGGRRYQTISSRIGENIEAGGWAARFPWPASWRAHFLGADHLARV